MPKDANKAGQLNQITALLERSPIAGLVALLAIGGGAGTLGSIFVAPVVDDALDEHARDPFAHASEFSQLREFDARLTAIERQLSTQGEQIATVSRDVKAAIVLLER
jgi:hypothetical protein